MLSVEIDLFPCNRGHQHIRFLEALSPTVRAITLNETLHSTMDNLNIISTSCFAWLIALSAWQEDNSGSPLISVCYSHTCTIEPAWKSWPPTLHLYAMPSLPVSLFTIFHSFSNLYSEFHVTVGNLPWKDPGWEETWDLYLSWQLNTCYFKQVTFPTFLLQEESWCKMWAKNIFSLFCLPRGDGEHTLYFNLPRMVYFPHPFP